MKKIVSIFIVVVSFLIVGMTSNAAGFTIDVKPEIPSNQQGDSVSLFNLQMDSDEEKTYTLHINNNGDAEKSVDIMVVNASTLPDGIIDESNPEAKMVKGAKNLLTDMTTLSDDQVLVPAKGTKDVTFTIKTPKKKFPGIVLGGIYVLDKNEDSKSDGDKSGMSIHNQMGYQTEVMLSTSDNQVKAKLDLDKVSATAHGGHPSLEIPIQNINPNIIPDLKVETEITKQGTKKVIVKDVKPANQLAPQSIFPHQVKLSDDEVKPGSYSAHIKATSEYGEWEWNRDFKITSKEAKAINERTIQKTTPLWVYLVAACFGLLGLVIAYLVYRMRKMAKQNKE